LRDERIEVFLAHPGGPFWAKKDLGAWTIPKGSGEPGEDLLAAAQREFWEETGIQALGPFVSLGSVRQKAGKVVHAWAWEGDVDASTVRSNMTRTEWPPGSGKLIVIPEIDRCEWFELEVACVKLNAAQAEFLDRLKANLG
jgi:predicted NUDIX family NTP pyrophosphohydrolase